MRCNDAMNLIQEYVDGRLDEAKKNSLLSHIDSCEYCREELKALTLLKSALNGLPEEEPPPGLLAGALAKAKVDMPVSKTKFMPRRAVAGIAAALVITAGAIWFLNSNMYRENAASDMAAPKAQMFTAMEAPAPEEFLAGEAAPQAEAAMPFESASAAASSMAPAASSMPPAASEEPKAAARGGETPTENGADESERIAQQDSSQVARIEIVIEAGKAKSFKEDFMAFVSKNTVIIETEVLDGTESFLFLLNEPLLPEFEALMKKHELKQLQLPALPVNILIVFTNS